MHTATSDALAARFGRHHATRHRAAGAARTAAPSAAAPRRTAPGLYTLKRKPATTTVLGVPARCTWFLAMACVVAAGACGEGAAKARDDRTAAVYVAVLQEVLGPLPETNHKVVYVAPFADQKSLPLETQAAVIADLKDQATVRFVDAVSEAVDAEASGAPAKDGVVVVLGPVPSTGSTVEVDAERYESESAHVSIRFRATVAGNRWAAEAVETHPIPPTSSA
jgi:hypothetical protein